MLLASLLLVASFQHAFESYDFAAAARAGAPADLEERAWYIVNVVRVDSTEGQRLAEQMRDEHPDSQWSWLALAYAYQDDLDHVDDNKFAAEKKLSVGTNESIVIARALAYNSILEPEVALNVLDAQQPQTARVLIAKAGVYQGSNDAEKAIAAYRQALELEPSNTMALARLGSMLKQLRRRDEAMPYLERAAKVAPYVMATQLPNAEALDAWIRDSGGDPWVLGVAMRGFQLLKNEERVCELQDRILREAPSSWQAMNVLMMRGHTPMFLRDIINYPYRHDPEYIAMAAASLIRDSTDDREIVALAHSIPMTVENTVRLQFAAQKLADRKLDLDYAEKIARRAKELNEIYLLPLRIDSAETRAKLERSSNAMVLDTLGWVLLAEGRVKEAERELTAAREMYPESSTSAYHLGRAFEAQKMTTKAEQLYREGLSLQSNGVNPNRTALEDLYRAKHKTLAGFDAYLKRVSTTGESASKERVLATRIAHPKRAPAFRLKSLDGKTVSLADLEGKVAVVNFWGVWCGWCVKEMPDLARLAKRYAGDSGVRIVTIDTDTDPAVVRQWMKDHHYDFPVLLDDGWTHRAGIFEYPTTWFLDPYGRIAFKKEGWTEKLVDQFSWRIDVLKK